MRLTKQITRRANAPLLLLIPGVAIGWFVAHTASELHSYGWTWWTIAGVGVSVFMVGILIVILAIRSVR